MKTFLFILLCCCSIHVSASPIYIVERLISVYDGDTIRVDLQGDNDLFFKNISIRFARIDTPEMRATSNQERQKAIQAKMALIAKLATCKKIVLRDVKRGKYFRLVAEVYCDHENVNNMMLKRGLANKYY